MHIFCEIALGCMPIISSQHWFRYWLGAVRQQAIIWANVDPFVCHHMVSLDHNGLTYHQKDREEDIPDIDSDIILCLC